MAEDKTGREISKEFLSALKKYFTVFVIQGTGGLCASVAFWVLQSEVTVFGLAVRCWKNELKHKSLSLSLSLYIYV